MTVEREELIKEFPGKLWVYSSEGGGAGEERVIRITFALAFLGVGLFSVTRLFLVHWVWLIPVSLGSAGLLGLTLLATTFRKKPLYGIRVTRTQICLEPAFSQKSQSVTCHPSSAVTVTRLGEGGSPPEGFRLLVDGVSLCECYLVQVRDVSLYGQIFDYFSLAPKDRPDIDREEKKTDKTKMSWFLLSYGLIALLLAAWAVYENGTMAKPDIPFSNP